MKKVNSGRVDTNADRPVLPPTASVKIWNWSIKQGSFETGTEKETGDRGLGVRDPMG